jgi:regulation of enolase protein 1 (concanavalin A-like superfamily)
MFLIPNPLAGKGDFRITLGVTRFEPTTPYHQVGLLCYLDDDNYLKWTFEANWRNPGTTNLVLVRETNQESEHDLVVELANPKRFWLRVAKQGNDYQCSYSTDGWKFTVVGKLPWGDGAPKYVGFLAKNGGTPDTPEIDAVIESFDLASPPRTDRAPAKPAPGRD